MSMSGDPRKQERPDGREPGTEVTKAFPPGVTGVVTEFGCEVVPFPFASGTGIRLEAKCGPMLVHLMLEPTFADVVSEAIKQAGDAATLMQSGVRLASPADVQALTNGRKQ